MSAQAADAATPAYSRGKPNNYVPAASERALVARHTELVRRIARHLAARLPSSVDVDDLNQAGLMGLLDAARHYDGSAGASFETYAGIRIRGAMVDELRANDWAPRSVHKKVRDAAEAMRKLEQEFGHSAREIDVAQRLGITLEDYRAILIDATQCQMLSIDAPQGEDEEPESRQVADSASIAPQEHLQNEQFQKALAGAIKRLPEKEQLVLSLYYREGLNLREIGQVMNVTESRVCQIHGEALTRVRSLLPDWITPKSRRSRG